MKNQELIDALFHDNNLKLVDLNKGLTNKNYLMTFHNESFVLRVPCSDSHRIVNRHHETLAIEAIKKEDIDVETIFYDEISGYKITRYLPDARTYKDCNDPDKIERVAILMKKFHSLHKKIHVQFDPIARFHQYHRYLHNPLFVVDSYTYIIEEVSKLHNEVTLCHNDWVDGNMLFTKEHTYLIDYEYAADNDPLFDVVSFLSENNIYDSSLRERFYTTYFDHLSDQTRKELQLWEAFADMLWCTWAMMMWEQRNEVVYKEIANDKFMALQRIESLRKP